MPNTEPIYPPVLSKLDFVERYQSGITGEFGNRAPTWNSLEEWKATSDFQGLYHVRNRVVGAPTWYNLPFYDVIITWLQATYYGYPPEKLYISEMAPTPLTLIQGEVMRDVNYLYLYYSTVKKPMRAALAEDAKHASGILSVSILRHFLCPNSYDWLWTLLERYPDHVVEFSTYATNWGTLPNFNTVFWEVRGGY